MSNPVWDDLLILLLAPNLDEIVPDIGLIREIPMLALPEEVFNDVLTLPVAPYFFVPFLATVITLAGSIYSLAIASSLVISSPLFCSYFSIILILSKLELFFSFNSFTICSASSKVAT